MGDMEMAVDVVVVGGGPGGYAAAFRAADLGFDVALIDRRVQPGGVCLHEGCIPSKTMLHLAELLLDARSAGAMGIHYSEPIIDLEAIRLWKHRVVNDMADGLTRLCDSRGVQLIQGKASYESSTTIRLEGSEFSRLSFKYSVVATGSQPIPFPGIAPSENSRIMASTEALALVDIPEKMVVIGGGYIGLEIGTIYAALGCRIQLVELQNRLLRGVDSDLVQPLQRRLAELFESIHLATSITSLVETVDGVIVKMKTAEGEVSTVVDRVLVAMGRKPCSQGCGLENTGVKTDSTGYIVTDDQQRTAEQNIFAVGDVAGGVMLAHTAIRQGRVAAEVMAGQKSSYDVRAIPAVVYTDPQIAWCGLTETVAKKDKIVYRVETFPWKYSGRAKSMGQDTGFTKILFDPDDSRILGVGITGRDVEGLIAEGVLAIEMAAIAEDLALTLHPHPTLSETMGETAEIFLGSPTHLLPQKRT